MKAVVYQSNTGYTQKYAELLAEKTGLPVYSRQEAGKALSKGDDIIYLSWLCAGALMGYKKAAKTWHVRAVCAVGMGSPAANEITDIVKKYQMDPAQAFYLQGGFDMSKLHGIYRLMMKTMIKSVVPSLEKKPDKTEDEIAALDLMKNGGDRVCVENLDPLLAWLQQEAQ